jgi:hypothetical protein
LSSLRRGERRYVSTSSGSFIGRLINVHFEALSRGARPLREQSKAFRSLLDCRRFLVGVQAFDEGYA